MWPQLTPEAQALMVSTSKQRNPGPGSQAESGVPALPGHREEEYLPPPHRDSMGALLLPLQSPGTCAGVALFLKRGELVPPVFGAQRVCDVQEGLQ